MTIVTAVEKKPWHLEDVLIKYRISGWYHLSTLPLIWIALATNTLYSNHFIFSAPDVRNQCADPGYKNNSCAVLSNNSYGCSELIYDDPESFVAEFQLGCHEWKRTLVGTVHSFGYMVGLIFVGLLSDKWGRKKLIIITGVLGGIIGISKSLVSYYWLYIALEFLEAAAGDLCSPFFTLTMEMVASNRRIVFQTLCSFGYTFGGILLPLVAYLFPYWRHFLQVIYTPALFFIFYIFLIDESPRWLLSRGRKEEAVKILEKAARQNNVELDKNVLEKLSCEQQEATNFILLLKDTFASRSLMKRFLVCLVWWTTSTFVNYGLTINSVSLQGNKYINYALISIVDIPSMLIVMYSLLKFKRKIPLIFTFVSAAILCLCQPFVPDDMPWLSVLLYMLGKLMSSAYFNITYIYTSELFPTYTRNSMHALCSSLGRIGSIIAPQTPLLMHYWPGLPAMIFGGASLLAGLVTFLVPDTADDALPDTVKQAEALDKTAEKEGKHEL